MNAAISDFDEEEVFHRASQLQDPAERREFLESVCKDESEVTRIESLLSLSDTSDDFLETPAISIDPGTPLDAMTPGTKLGRYQIERKIGSGGFGDVYLASQTKPVQRHVAIKILRPAPGSKLLERFRTEQQTLAGLEHPGIARLIDAGETDNGHPFYVMEYINGVALDKWLADQELELDDRLSVFDAICDAVAHAHQKGVIHRDLKPANIIVTTEGKVVPHVIDFGIAKIISGASSLGAVVDGQQTMDGQILGTPLYMAPEQLKSSGDVDVRADVHSLGSLLYYIVSGQSPVEAAGAKSSLHDAFNAIADLDAPILSRVAKAAIPVELDWIANKALRKTPCERYQSVRELQQDIARLRSGRPVSVGPLTWRYTAKKWIDRNRLVTAMLGLVAASLIAGGIALAIGKQRAQVALKAEQQARAETTVERDRAEQIVTLLSQLAGASNVRTNRPHDYTVRELLNELATELDTKLQGQEDVELRLRHILGRSFASYGDTNAAEPNLRRCQELCQQLKSTTPNVVAQVDLDLGMVLQDASKIDEAEQLIRKAVASEKLGIDRRVAACHALSEIARFRGQVRRSAALCEEAFEISKESDDPSLMCAMQAYFARACFSARYYERAEKESAAALSTITELENAREVDLATVQRLRSRIVRKEDARAAGKLISSARRIDEEYIGPSLRLVADVVIESQTFKATGRLRQAAQRSAEAKQMADALTSQHGAACMTAYQNDAELCEGIDNERAMQSWNRCCEFALQLTGKSNRSSRVLLSAGKMAFLLGRDDLAEEHLSLALKSVRSHDDFFRNEPSILYYLGCTQVSKGRITEAKKTLEPLSELDSFSAKMLQVAIHLAENDVQTAQQIVNELIDQQESIARGQTMEVNLWKIRVALRSGDKESAQETIDEVRSSINTRRGTIRVYVDAIDRLEAELEAL